MTQTTPQQMIDALDEILDQEREALLKGDLAALEPMVAEKDALITGLNALDKLEEDTISNVQGKVVRNQALLTSAMEGIKAVASRMSELRKVRKGLDVYDRSGTKSSYSTQGAKSLEKRA